MKPKPEKRILIVFPKRKQGKAKSKPPASTKPLRKSFASMLAHCVGANCEGGNHAKRG